MEAREVVDFPCGGAIALNRLTSSVDCAGRLAPSSTPTASRHRASSHSVSVSVKTSNHRTKTVAAIAHEPIPMIRSLANERAALGVVMPRGCRRLRHEREPFLRGGHAEAFDERAGPRGTRCSVEWPRSEQQDRALGAARADAAHAFESDAAAEVCMMRRMGTTAGRRTARRCGEGAGEPPTASAVAGDESLRSPVPNTDRGVARAGSCSSGLTLRRRVVPVADHGGGDQPIPC